MTDKELVLLARAASENAHVPYSGFPVGAALECADGRIFTGCNVENIADGCTICAERTAMVKAISEGCRDFARIAVYGDGKEYCYPCGACRQFMAEFNDGSMTVLCSRGTEDIKSFVLRELLPGIFGF